MTIHLIEKLITSANCIMVMSPIMGATQGSGSIICNNNTANEKSWGIINVSVCNLRQSGDYDAGMASQALLGTPIKVLKDSSWLEIETPDHYKSWMLESSLCRVTKDELKNWNEAPQVVVTAIYGFVYSKNSIKSQTVSDVVASDRLKLLDKKGKFYHVAYPDGRTGYLPISDGAIVNKWREEIRQDAKSIIASAMKLMGIPYMWGGMSTKGADCSGFVRTVFMEHDIILPRDASQQALVGAHIDIASDFSNLIPGDLLFFGCDGCEKEVHVCHVGLYIGEQKFIHSLGCVHISSFNPKDKEYDEYNRNRLLWAQRVLPYINQEEGIQTTDRNEFYK
jgi:hypothetical protein